MGQKRLSLSSYSPVETRLKEALSETIEVLEQTRKAFKSKRLEAFVKGSHTSDRIKIRQSGMSYGPRPLSGSAGEVKA